jgi:tripartite-type tricarboxylate transporter receptor subunit TctC
LTVVAAGLLSLRLPLSAIEPPWPQHTVRFILPLGAGAGSDIGARLFAERLAVALGPAGGSQEPSGR